MNKAQTNLIDRRGWGWLVLFASSTTLICCALPILLVTLGLGAVSASLFSTLPFLVSLTHYKLLLFILSGVLLCVSTWLVFKSNRACPTDPKLAAQCQRAHRFNRWACLISIVVWLLGFATAYLALPIWKLFNT